MFNLIQYVNNLVFLLGARGNKSTHGAEMKGFTDKQRKVFEFIKSQIVETNRPPTLREMCAEFGMSSTGSVQDVVRALIKKGYIEKEPHVSRGIKIKKGPGPISGNIVELPVVSRVKPGAPITLYENAEEILKVDRSMVPEGVIFAVKVKDNSMIEACIGDGDYAFVKTQLTCRQGQIVAVTLSDEVKLKRFSRKGNKVVLLSKGKKLKQTTLDNKRFKAALLGVVVGVYRRY